MVQDTWNGYWGRLSHSKTSKRYKMVGLHRFINAEPSGNTCSLPRPQETSLIHGLVFPVK